MADKPDDLLTELINSRDESGSMNNQQLRDEHDLIASGIRNHIQSFDLDYLPSC